MIMKSKVSLGKTGTLTTLLVSVLLNGAVIWPIALDIAIVSWVMLATVAATLISQLFYAPVSIELTDDALIVHRLLARKVIPVADIRRSASLHYPSGPIRTCGCSGFFGNWGYFTERGIGSYFAYYGDPADCFLVKLANGRKYMLGCRNAADFVAAIDSRISLTD